MFCRMCSRPCAWTGAVFFDREGERGGGGGGGWGDGSIWVREGGGDGVGSRLGFRVRRPAAKRMAIRLILRSPAGEGAVFVPMARGFVFLVAVIDCFSREVLSLHDLALPVDI